MNSSSSSSFFDRSLHPFKGEREKRRRRRKNGADRLTDWGGRKREKMMTKPVFAPFLSQKVKVTQLGPFSRQSPLIQRAREGTNNARLVAWHLLLSILATAFAWIVAFVVVKHSEGGMTKKCR